MNPDKKDQDKKNEEKKEEKIDKKVAEELEDFDKNKSKPVDEADIDLLKRYGRGPYSDKIKKIEEDIKDLTEVINKACGIRESDTGLSQPTYWVIEVKIIL